MNPVIHTSVRFGTNALQTAERRIESLEKQLKVHQTRQNRNTDTLERLLTQAKDKRESLAGQQIMTTLAGVMDKVKQGHFERTEWDCNRDKTFRIGREDVKVGIRVDSDHATYFLSIPNRRLDIEVQSIGGLYGEPPFFGVEMQQKNGQQTRGLATEDHQTTTQVKALITKLLDS